MSNEHKQTELHSGWLHANQDTRILFMAFFKNKSTSLRPILGMCSIQITPLL
jgi:hypothetical protein